MAGKPGSREEHARTVEWMRKNVRSSSSTNADRARGMRYLTAYDDGREEEHF